MNDDSSNDEEKNKNGVYIITYNVDDEFIMIDDQLADNLIGTQLNKNYKTVHNQFIDCRSSPNEITNISGESTNLQNKTLINSQNSKTNSISSCLMCQNGDFPTGTH